MNIFEISKELESVFDELEENGGELTDELEEKLSISQDEFRSKVDAYLSVIRHTESDVDCCDKEIKRLQAVKKSKQNAIERLNNIKHSLFFILSIKTRYFSDPFKKCLLIVFCYSINSFLYGGQ